uniref:RING-type E3 ubiquitin transferase n=1 Tax=Anopheles atroparvus TaxID=41427 RepID=A0AAG5D0Y3_ANOAO
MTISQRTAGSVLEFQFAPPIPLSLSLSIYLSVFLRLTLSFSLLHFIPVPHPGVSCDSCLKSNFRGRRYKCLICYDYDLCANCYEEGATTTRHSADHPMQCILTQSDFELYYGGEVLQPDQPQSFTCPYCKRMGLSDAALLEHVSAEHTDTGLEVVCPVCAAQPGGEPNFVTDDFARHLSLEHRSGTRDLISFLDEPSAIRHGGVRRMPHSGRALGGPRSRRSNMHFSSSGGGLSTLSPSGRESVDPIAELLQQLSNVRRGGAPQPSQLQQLQMQIQLERQQVTVSVQPVGQRTFCLTRESSEAHNVCRTVSKHTVQQTECNMNCDQTVHDKRKREMDVLNNSMQKQTTECDKDGRLRTSLGCEPRTTIQEGCFSFRV